MPKTSTERSRESRARKNVAPVKKLAKTSAERTREHRARKNVPSVKKPAKTAAERNREYRARKKALGKAANQPPTAIKFSTSVLTNDDIVNQESSQQITTDTEVEVRKDNHSLLYGYLNHRWSSRNKQVGDNHRSVDVQIDVHERKPSLLSGNPSTSTVRGQSMSQNDTIPVRKRTTTPKTPAQRSRDYRARRKALKITGIQRQRPLPLAQQLEMKQDPIDDIANNRRKKAYGEFTTKFINNSLGHICSVCDRSWLRANLKSPSSEHAEILNTILPHISMENIALCDPCLTSLNKNKIPTMSTFNGFKDPQITEHLPPMDSVSETLISPRLPFTQIRRLRHVNGQDGSHILQTKLKPDDLPSQNLPVMYSHHEVTTMATNEAQIVKTRPRPAKRKNISVNRSDFNAIYITTETETETESETSNNEIHQTNPAIIGGILFETIEETVDSTGLMKNNEDLTSDLQPIAQITLQDVCVAPNRIHKISNNSNSEEIVDEKTHRLSNTKLTVVYDRTTQFGRSLTVAEFITSNSQLYYFSGIKTFELLEKVGECVNKIEIARKRRNKFAIPVKDRILLTLMKLKMKMSFQCVALLFQIQRETCKMYFHCTIPSLSEACPALIVNVTEGKLKKFKFKFSSGSL